MVRSLRLRYVDIDGLCMHRCIGAGTAFLVGCPKLLNSLAVYVVVVTRGKCPVKPPYTPPLFMSL